MNLETAKHQIAIEQDYGSWEELCNNNTPSSITGFSDAAETMCLASRRLKRVPDSFYPAANRRFLDTTLEQINCIMHNSYTVRGTMLNKEDGDKIMALLDKWAKNS